ncbi:hypothetical protein D6D01_08668 [Aureobasidium pullulans]|uniref:Aminoglycoside phosphotransferase domain-containing protein n=1 Tax=Aureobasidium pullulans TaxID=5580 RepID=A0A4S9KAI4_AURPU|nr:hypothetical protein D6D01_08668 [Aureobasidium pullulans]
MQSWLSSKKISPRQEYSPSELILRISGNHISKIKTNNEAAVLLWLRDNTNIPVPRVVAHDSSTNNSLGQEYILMTREPGESLSDVYGALSSAQMDSVLDQLIDINAGLHKHTWSHIGGFSLDESGAVIPGPVLEETFWFEPDIAALWPASETYSSLNILGPFNSYVDYISAHMLKYKHAIEVHSSLKHMHDILPQLESFLKIINKEPMWTKLNSIPLRLAHKDLHFANILIDPATARITSILDWEFAGVVPFTRWNPSRAFLWNAQENSTSRDEKIALMERYERRCKERGCGYLIEDAEFTSKEQENMQTAATYLRVIVEVCPRGEGMESVIVWKETAVKAMSALGA